MSPRCQTLPVHGNRRAATTSVAVSLHRRIAGLPPRSGFNSDIDVHQRLDQFMTHTCYVKHHRKLRFDVPERSPLPDLGHSGTRFESLDMRSIIKHRLTVCPYGLARPHSPVRENRQADSQLSCMFGVTEGPAACQQRPWQWASVAAPPGLERRLKRRESVTSPRRTRAVSRGDPGLMHQAGVHSAAQPRRFDAQTVVLAWRIYPGALASGGLAWRISPGKSASIRRTAAHALTY